MNRVDGVILGVGVVVLVASIIGVILYDEAGGPTFNIAWQEASSTLAEQTDSGAAGEYTFTQQVTGGYLSAVAFNVEVSANGLRATPDQVSVTVAGPGGQGRPCSFEVAAGPSGSGTCEARTEVQGAPDQTTATGATAEEAEQAAEDSLVSTAGEGRWTVTVTITGGQGGVGPAAASYTIAVTPTVHEWNAKASPFAPDGPNA